uniref:Uncharacterized protein n=1 Tax=Lepeophtheirus salmonis TaxID=72036 RepID=A0A0K2UAU2_LEPSM
MFKPPCLTMRIFLPPNTCFVHKIKYPSLLK